MFLLEKKVIIKTAGCNICAIVFLVYCITGNPLYDHKMMWIYAVAVGFAESKNLVNSNHKKVGILTFHNTLNYGASLQAYALCRVLRNIGADAEIIDYHCENISSGYETAIIGVFLKMVVI